jgi:hypothetical protein
VLHVSNEDPKKPTLRGILGLKANQILVPKDRVVTTGQGCWNCRHWDRDKAKILWSSRRQGELQKVLEASLNSPDGEQDAEVQRCKNFVDQIDRVIASGHAGLCVGGGVDAKGNPVEFVVHEYKCEKWSGVTGASLAREGGKQDPLPMELADKLNKPN